VLGVLAALAKSLTSLTLHSNDQTLAFTNVIHALSPARARLQTLKLRLWCIGQALPIQEMWPTLKELSLEFHHSQGQERKLNALLQVCTNLERLKLQRLKQNCCMYAFLSGLERLTSLRHLEVGPSVSNSCVKRILALSQLRSLVLRDSFKLLPSYLCKLSEHPNLQSLALHCTLFFTVYDDFVDSVNLSRLVEALLQSKRLQQVTSNFKIRKISTKAQKSSMLHPRFRANLSSCLPC
jgi:hypothetical protein